MQQLASLNVECLAEMVLRRLKKKKNKAGCQLRVSLEKNP